MPTQTAPELDLLTLEKAIKPEKTIFDCQDINFTYRQLPIRPWHNFAASFREENPRVRGEYRVEYAVDSCALGDKLVMATISVEKGILDRSADSIYERMTFRSNGVLFLKYRDSLRRLEPFTLRLTASSVPDDEHSTLYRPPVFAVTPSYLRNILAPELFLYPNVVQGLREQQLASR